MLKNGTFIRNKYYRFAISTLLMWLVSLAANLADTVIAGAYLTSEAVSAVGLVTPLGAVVSFLAFMISLGGSLLYGREKGAFHEEEAARVVGHSVISAAGIGVFCALVLFAIKDTYLGMYHCSEELTALAGSYYNGYIFTALISPMMCTLYQLVAMDGDEICPLLNDIVVAAVNAAASILLVRKMGTAGLSLGTVISILAGSVPLLAHLFLKSNTLRLKWSFRWKRMAVIARLGLIKSLTALYTGLVDIIFNAFVIQTFGEGYLPAYTVVNFCLNLAMVTLTPVNGAASFLSVAYGEKNPSGIRSVMKHAAILELPLTVLLSVVMLVLSGHWADMYAITDPAVRQAASFAAVILPLSYLFVGYLYLFAQYYGIVGHDILGNIMIFYYSLLLPLVLPTVFSRFWGFRGLAWGFALVPVITLLLTYVPLLLQKKRADLPLLLMKTDEASRDWEISVSPDHIAQLQAEAGDFMSGSGINSRLSNEIQLMLEETLLQIREYNNRKKRLLAEVSLFISDEHVRVIIRDNGIVFDLTDIDQKISSLRCYVIARMAETADERTSTATISYNRNSFQWKREEP